MGKTLNIVDTNLQLSENKIHLYAIFKQKDDNTLLAIFHNQSDNDKAFLRYASVNFKKNILVLNEIDNKEEIIKEFTWKLINGKQNEGFDIINADKYNMVQINTNKYLLVKSNVIDALYNNTLKKEDNLKIDNKENEKNNTEKNINKKENKSKKINVILLGIITIIFIAILSFIIIFLIKGLLSSNNIKYQCINSYLDVNTGANKQEIQELSFDKNNNLIARTIITKYKFNNNEEYKKYYNNGTYYKIKNQFKYSQIEYQNDDKNLTLKATEYVGLDNNYTDKRAKKELLEELINQNFECQDVNG